MSWWRRLRGGGTSTRLPETVVGVVKNIDQLIDVINDPSRPAGDRVTAAGLVRSSIDNTSVSSIQELWYSCRSLLEITNPAEVRRAGWRLLKSCVGHDDINNGAFAIYYHTIVCQSNVEDFDLVLEGLDALTQGGKRILGGGYLTPCRLPLVIISWIQVMAVRAQELRANPLSKDMLLSWGTSSEQCFHTLLEFVEANLKFSMVIWEPGDLENLLLVVVAVMRSTSSVRDAELLCTLIDTVFAYGILPVQVLQPVLEVLCGSYAIVPQLASRSWAIVFGMCWSHLRGSTVTRLRRILEGGENTNITVSMRVGAAKVLGRLFIESWEPSKQQSTAEESEEFQGVAPLYVIQAYRGVVERPDLPPKLLTAIAEVLYDILTKSPVLRESGSGMWVWQTGDDSPLGLIRALCEIASSSPDNAPTSTLAEIMDSIIDLVSAQPGLIPTEEVAETCLKAAQYNLLTVNSTVKLVDLLKVTHYCSPYLKGWTRRVSNVLKALYMVPGAPSAVRIAVIALVRDVFVVDATEVVDESDGQNDYAEGKSAIKTTASTTGNSSTEVDKPLVECIYSPDAMADPAVCDVLLTVLDDVYDCSNLSWTAFSRVTSSILNLFAENNEPSASHAQATKRFSDLFSRSLLVLPRQASHLFSVLIEICKRTISSDAESFGSAWAALCRLRADSSGRLMFTEPLIEDGYTEDLKSLQVPAPPSTKNIYDQASLVVDCDLVNVSQVLILIRDALIQETDEKPEAMRVFLLVLVNSASQLSNMRLFASPGQAPVLEDIRNWIYTYTTATARRQQRVIYASVAIHLLTVLLPYDDLFPRVEQDRLVQQLVISMNSWDSSCHWTIHCLVTCCYECPHSIQKYLPQILSKLQTKITTKDSSMFIVQFLLSISLVESLTDYFTLQDFKRVFGMCFIYIQSAHELLGASDIQTGTDAESKKSAAPSEIVPQYLISLAYTTISNLYLAIDVESRPTMVPYLVRNLTLADHDTSRIDDMSLAVYDLVARFTYSDMPLTLLTETEGLAAGVYSDYDKRRWLRGNNVIEHRVHRLTGDGIIVIRRPTGTVVLQVRPALRSTVTVPTSATAEEPMLFSPNFYMLLSQELGEDDTPQGLPIAIPFDSQTDRAIAALDRAPVVDFHKVGIIYVGPGQTTETEILANTAGSASYRRFLDGIGTLVRLKNNKSFYVGGLDTENDLDGKWAYGWRSKIAQMIFHTTTMMPGRVDDGTFASKKRHIGNNFVNIYFDESCQEFKFDIMKSQFNFINLVVTPTYSPGKWRVRAYRKEHLANALTAYEVKVVSEANLPLFVRNLAIKASKYASVHSMRGEYTENWVYRLRLTRQLRERLVQRPSKTEEDEDDDEGRSIALLKWFDFTKWSL